MASDEIVAMSLYTELATREQPQRELELTGDLMQLRKVKLSIPTPTMCSHAGKLVFQHVGRSDSKRRQ